MSERLIVTSNLLSFHGKTYHCAIGKSGFSDHKKEGDGCTPLGAFLLRECWYRADRMSPPKTRLPLHIINRDDGWCDDVRNKDYNRHIKISSSAKEYSFERLWHDDHVYDLIIPMGYNDDPIVSGKGSAIFLHIVHEDCRPTEGCVALAKDDLLTLLPHLDTNSLIEIRKA